MGGDHALVAQAREDRVRGHRRRGVAELVEAHAVRGHAGAQAQLRQRAVGRRGAGRAGLELRLRAEDGVLPADPVRARAGLAVGDPPQPVAEHLRDAADVLGPGTHRHRSSALPRPFRPGSQTSAPAGEWTAAPTGPVEHRPVVTSRRPGPRPSHKRGSMRSVADALLRGAEPCAAHAGSQRRVPSPRGSPARDLRCPLRGARRRAPARAARRRGRGARAGTASSSGTTSSTWRRASSPIHGWRWPRSRVRPSACGSARS